MVHQMPSGLPYLQSGMLPFQQRAYFFTKWNFEEPFQQQIDPFQSGGQPGFLPPPAFLNQGMHNQNSAFFGMMGTLLPMIGYNQCFQAGNNIPYQATTPCCSRGLITADNPVVVHFSYCFAEQICRFLNNYLSLFLNIMRF